MEKITWTTIEYLHQEKDNDWYWIVGIVTVTVAIVSILLNNLIFAILILVSSFILTLFASKEPKVLNVEIGDKEIIFGKTKFPYKELEAYWIETKEGLPRIILKSKKIFIPYISIFLEETDPEIVDDILSKKIKKEEMTEPLFEKLLLYFGF